MASLRPLARLGCPHSTRLFPTLRSTVSLRALHGSSSTSATVKEEQSSLATNVASAARPLSDAPMDPREWQPRNNPAFILHGKLKTSFEELPVPDPGPDEVLIEVKKTGICGSDVHFYNTGSMGLVHCTSAMALGHESAGVIVRLGSNLAKKAADARAKAEKAAKRTGTDAAYDAVEQPVLRLGDQVALEPGVTCRMCHDCRSGQYNVSAVSCPTFNG